MRVTHVLAVAALVTGCQRHEPHPAATAQPDRSKGTLPVGVTACDRYLRRVADCPKLSQAARDAFLLGVNGWKRASEHPGEPAKAAARSCEDVLKLAEPQLAELGC